MFALMMRRAAWSDYFTGTPNNIEPKEYSEQQTLSSTSIYVLNCLFNSISSTNSGGALCSLSSVTNLLIELTSFFSCKTTKSNGGAIYYQNNNGQCVLHEVCGYDCCSTCTSTPYYQFALIHAKNDASAKNYINYSSIVRCVNENSNSYYTLYLCNGKNDCPSINMSMNRCQYFSGIVCNPIDTCSLSYSSFADNTATGNTCIQFLKDIANYEIKSCNILRNTQDTHIFNGMIWTHGTLMIENSCILENEAKYIFQNQYSSTQTITLSNCTVDSTSACLSVVIRNTVTKSFILALSHMSTRNCHSEYDSAGTLTPITPPPPPSKNQSLYCMCEKFFYKPRQRNFVSLI